MNKARKMIDKGKNPFDGMKVKGKGKKNGAMEVIEKPKARPGKGKMKKDCY